MCTKICTNLNDLFWLIYSFPCYKTSQSKYYFGRRKESDFDSGC